MKIVVIQGQSHKGSTYHITKQLLDQLSEKTNEVLEFQTNDIKPCIGCFSCVIKDESLCPQRSVVGPIIEAIERSDVIVIGSPTYCLEMSGQLKTFFDHMTYRWISHRPYASMKRKIGVAISTTAGAGSKGTTRSIARQMFYWGIAKTYRIHFAVAAMNWNDVKPDTKIKITGTIKKTAAKIERTIGKAKPGIRWKIMFNLMKKMQKGNLWCPVDRKHWEDNGWI